MATITPRADTEPQPSRAALAAAILSALSDAGITRMDAADHAGIPRSTFYRKATGLGKAFDADELAAIAQVLGTTVSALVASAESRAA